MKIHKILFSSIFIISYTSSYGHVFGVLAPATFFTSDVLSWAEQFWSFVSSGHTAVTQSANDSVRVCMNAKPYVDGISARVADRVFKLYGRFSVIGKELESRRDVVEDIIQKSKGPFNLRMHRLYQSTRKVDGIYEELSSRLSEMSLRNFIGKEYCRFANKYVQSLTSIVDSIYAMVLPSTYVVHSLVTQLAEELKLYETTFCGKGASTSDILYAVYTSLVLTEIKAYVLTAFSHNVLFTHRESGGSCHYNYESPEVELARAQKKLNRHLQRYNKIFIAEMNKISGEFRACDQGNDFIRDETYFELEGAIQVIVQYPYAPPAFSLDPNPESYCGAIDTRGTPEMYCNSKEKFCIVPLARNCLGWTHSCAMHSFIDGCLAEKSSRRYHWLRWSHKDTSIAPDCPDNSKMSLTAKPKIPCVCVCNDNDVDSISTHIFNLQWVKSDVSRNMVLTGVRFIVKNRIMQFQIQQGLLRDQFRIENAEWKPVNDINEEIRAARLNRKLRGKVPGVVENEDFLVITQDVNNAINLDTLRVPHSHVLIGVRFKLSTKEQNPPGRIEIELLAKEFNHMTGQLRADRRAIVVESNIEHHHKYEYPKANVNNPKFPTIPITSPGQYVIIDTSDLLKDGGQTTLPLFDALPLASNPPTALAGLGIYHKQKDDFTGFVSLKLLSLNYATYMEDNNVWNGTEISTSSISRMRSRKA